MKDVILEIIEDKIVTDNTVFKRLMGKYTNRGSFLKDRIIVLSN